MNQSGWNAGENTIRGRGDFRITPENVKRPRKTGLGEGIKNTGRRRAGWALGYQVPVRHIVAKTWGEGTELPKGRRHSYSGKRERKEAQEGRMSANTW